MKTDARIRYTKRVLREALLELMHKKSIKEITVTEVCDLAELNRATFYRHYRDCYDLLSQIENELLADYERSLRYIRAFDVADLVAAIFDMIEKNIDLCQLLIFERLDDTVIKKMIAVAHDGSIKNWRAQLPEATDDELELLFICLANGLARVIIEGYPRYDRATLTAFVNTMVKGCASAFSRSPARTNPA